MLPSIRRSLATTPTLLVAALLLAGCAPHEQRADTARLVHLALERIPGQEAPRELRVLEVEVPEASRGWGGQKPARLPGEGASEVRVWGDGGQLHVPDPRDLAGATRAVVHGRFPGGQHIELRLSAEGKDDLVTETTLPGDPSVVSEAPVRIDLAWSAEELRGPWEALDLTAKGEACEVERLELLATSPESELPPPGDPRLVGMGDDYRRGVGLAPGRGLQASFDAQAGDALAFDLGAPAGAGAWLGAARVTVTLESGDLREERAFALVEATRGGIQWGTQSIPLERFAGRRVVARFEMTDESQGRLAALVANPWVGHRGKHAPTVLLITSDTHRGDHLGAAHSGVEILTPTLDALAGRGVLFEDCYSTSNITAPSHAALLTGLTPRDTGLVSNEMRLDESARTLGEAFLAAGYRTVSVVSVQTLRQDWSAVAQGFERQRAPPLDQHMLRADQSVSELLEMIDEEDGLPLFVWLHVFDAHFPYEPPGRFGKLYYHASGNPFDPDLPAPDVDPEGLSTALAGLKDLEYPRARYSGEISYVDDQLRRLLSHPRMKDAVVGFTADHGEVLYRREALFDHILLLPATLHVPMVIAWPGAPGGKRVKAPVLQPDLGRTLLDLAGLVAMPFPGKDLARDLDARAVSDSPRFAIGDFGAHASVAYGRWFLLLQLADQDRRGFQLERHRVCLYDLEADPDCLADVVAEHHDVAAKLRRMLVDWLVTAPATKGAEDAGLNAEQLAQLRALGYAGDDGSAPTTQWIDPDCSCARCAAFR